MFCSTFTVLIMFVILCQAKATESLKKKGLVGAIILQKKKVEKRRQKRAFDYLRMSKPQAIFTRVAIVCHQYETLAVLQNVFAIILL